jgi:hypothetical protein
MANRQLFQRQVLRLLRHDQRLRHWLFRRVQIFHAVQRLALLATLRVTRLQSGAQILNRVKLVHRLLISTVDRQVIILVDSQVAVEHRAVVLIGRHLYSALHLQPANQRHREEFLGQEEQQAVVFLPARLDLRR